MNNIEFNKVQEGKPVMIPASDGHWLNKTAVLEMLTGAGVQCIEEYRNAISYEWSNF